MTPDDADGVRARRRTISIRCITIDDVGRQQPLQETDRERDADGGAADGADRDAFLQTRDVVGLDFSVRFHKAVFADETVTLEWEVVEVTPTSVAARATWSR